MSGTYSGYVSEEVWPNGKRDRPKRFRIGLKHGLLNLYQRTAFLVRANGELLAQRDLPDCARQSVRR
jgi:hypothetical protein